MTAPIKPNFAVAADESTYRRLLASVREDIWRLERTSYTFGVQTHTGLVNLDMQRAALNEQRNRIYGKLESIAMLIDMMGEMKDVNVNTKLTPTRRNRKKPTVEETWTPDSSESETTGAPSQPVTTAVDTASTTTAPAVPSQAQSSTLESATNLVAHPYRAMTESDLIDLAEVAA
jgi:hypothetical protein